MLKRLEEIKRELDNAPSLDKFQSNAEFMQFIKTLMGHSLYLLRLGVALAPSEKAASVGYTKHRAIIVGHLVRVVKLYEGFFVFLSRDQLELASLFIRPIFETAIRMIYLIKSKSKRKTIRNFILISYKPEKEMLEDLQMKESQRKLSPIERRIKRKIKKRLRQDRVSVTELMNNKTWAIDGKDFRSILRDLGMEQHYPYVFANSSHFIHGDWHEIYLHHLKRRGRYYKPKLSFTPSDPRASCPLTIFCLDVLMEFLRWNKSDPNNVVMPIIAHLREVILSVDEAHERMLAA